MRTFYTIGAKQFHQHYKISASLFLLFNFVSRIHAAYTQLNNLILQLHRIQYTDRRACVVFLYSYIIQNLCVKSYNHKQRVHLLKRALSNWQEERPPTQWSERNNKCKTLNCTHNALYIPELIPTNKYSATLPSLCMYCMQYTILYPSKQLQSAKSNTENQAIANTIFNL